MVPEWFDPNTQALSSLFVDPPKLMLFWLNKMRGVPSVFSKPERGGYKRLSLEILG